MKSHDIDAIQRAQTIVQSGLPELLRAEETKIVTELVNACNAGKLNDRDAAIGVAVIARIRRIWNSCNRHLSEGVDAGHKLRS
jgi:hypothetical protein